MNRQTMYVHFEAVTACAASALFRHLHTEQRHISVFTKLAGLEKQLQQSPDPAAGFIDGRQKGRNEKRTEKEKRTRNLGQSPT